MSQVNKMAMQQLAAVKASALALAGQVDALKETLKLLEQAYTEPEQKPGCPNCGSPRFVEMPSMTGTEKQCQDCRTTYGTEN